MSTTALPGFAHRLTPHFHLGEFALGQQERAFSEWHQLDTALRLARFGETVREKFGGPVIITSGYRPPLVNMRVGGDPDSEHLYKKPAWGAIDFYLPHADMFEVQKFCDWWWPYSLGRGVARAGFIHLGMGWGSPKARWNY